MRENKVKCGGVALFNGILFTSDIRQVQIERKDNNTIYAKVNKMNKMCETWSHTLVIPVCGD